MKKFKIIINPFGPCEMGAWLRVQAHGVVIAEDRKAVYILTHSGTITARIDFAHGVKSVEEIQP